MRGCVFLNKEVADRCYEVRLNAPTLLAVVLSSSSDASSLLPCIDSQVVKEVGGVRGAQQEATEGFESLDAGVLIFNKVKMFNKIIQTNLLLLRFNVPMRVRGGRW